MANTRLIVIGGFLGSGKTTAILSLALKMVKAGKKVGIVTNDQGSQLVDSAFLHSQGFPVLEVGGGCFCCNFDEFTKKLNQLSQEVMPDFILAEPVGSCTDLVATIMKPLKASYAQRFSLAPLSVVVDPKRMRRFMAEKQSTVKNPFPNEVNYLFEKQIEEADIIALNKCDMLKQEEIDELINFVSTKYPGVAVMSVSALSGLSMDNWANALTSLLPMKSFENSLSIEYDTYAKAEAALGWLNTSIQLKSDSSYDSNSFLEAISIDVKNAIKEQNQEIAHLKAYMVSGLDWCKLSCVSVFDEIFFDRRMSSEANFSTLIFNLRASCDPVFLKDCVEKAIHFHAEKNFIIIEGEVLSEAFRPSYPTPIHRM